MKTKQQILESLQRIALEVAEVPPDKVVVDASLRSDLGLDSLDMIDVVTAIEDDIGARLTDKEMSNIETVLDLMEVLFEAQQRAVTPV